MPKAKKVVEQYSSDEDSSGVSDAEVSYSGESSDDSQQRPEQQSDFSDDDSDHEEEDNGKDAKAEKIRQQLAAVPFSQLIRIQQQMGTSKFNQSMGLKEKTDTRKKVQQELKQRAGLSSSRYEDNSDADSGSDSSAPETASTKSGAGKKKDMHRDNRKMPAMMSSKRPVSRFRQVVEIAKPQTRDPRFDNLSGHFNEDLYEKSYGFLDKQQEEEIESLKAQMQKIKNRDPHEAQRIQTVVSSMQSQIAAKKQKKHTQELKRKHRKNELEAVKQGKTPYFLKKSELKGLEVAEKFTQLKGESKLDNYLEKRRKRNATKDHRRMPYKRRED
ncbi:rRNA biogenesis protein rrp36 [Coemansia aciculifera]|uniref:rRNA biogenesis protein RRP36 n=1 Tax=Coemansia aciculifera TaxID=417176 RepID=A0A9W8ISG2_9FUNG|nr:rRNA biogenesis protein rrp36 [Coemansia aciculifera]KAJ2874391.1 rRNA biogenesis protein rrp36 [Coemansia aciculifera]KAJ2883114.1 rRNA biogenesis protein rrp36 [Coemansia aciculifera]